LAGWETKRRQCGGSHEPQICRDGGIRGRAKRSDHAVTWQSRSARRTGMVFQRGEHRHRVSRRQGYQALRLHDRNTHGGGLHLGRHGTALGRPDAEAGGRDGDQSMRRRSRRHDFRSHNCSTDNGIQAVRPEGASNCPTTSGKADRAAAWMNRRAGLGAKRQPLVRAPASTGPWTAISNSPAHARAISRSSRACGRLRQRLRLKVVTEAMWETGCRRYLRLASIRNGLNINKECGSTSRRRERKVREMPPTRNPRDGDADG